MIMETIETCGQVQLSRSTCSKLVHIIEQVRILWAYIIGYDNGGDVQWKGHINKWENKIYD